MSFRNKRPATPVCGEPYEAGGTLERTVSTVLRASDSLPGER